MNRQVDAIQWGGGSRIFFRGLPKPTRFSVGGGSSTMNVPLMGPFYIFRLSRRGARAPGHPPLNRPLLMSTWTVMDNCQLYVGSARVSHFVDAETCEFTSLP